MNGVLKQSEAVGVAEALSSAAKLLGLGQKSHCPSAVAVLKDTLSPTRHFELFSVYFSFNWILLVISTYNENDWKG